MFYYAAALGTAQWLNLSDYRPVVWPLGILIVAFSFWSHPSTVEFSRYLVGVFPFYGLLIQTIIPLFLLVIAFVRKRKSRELIQYEEKDDGERQNFSTSDGNHNVSHDCRYCYS